VIGKFLLSFVLLACAAPASAVDHEPGKTAGDRPLPDLRESGSTDLYNDTKDAKPDTKKDAIHPHGWFKGGASLLYYDQKGDLATELPLVSDEEPSGNRVNVHEVRGAAAPNSRFGWTLERTTTWNQDRTKVYASRRLLRVFGSEGKELWNEKDADVPENGEPLIFSADGETALVSLRGDKGWTVQAKGWAGNTLIEVGPMPRLQLMSLTRNGRFAMIRWVVPDQSATHTFLELPSKTRQDIPSSELYLGLARVTEDGKIYSGKRFVFDFAAVKKDLAPEGLPPKPVEPAPSVFPSTAPVDTSAPPEQDKR
jgi:hypothetical protein